MTNASSRILVVDDEEVISWGLGRLLTDEGYAVRIAASAEEALELAAGESPDLVIMDVRLPGMDGFEAMKRLEAIAPAAPVIVITAFGNLETAVAAVERGAADYLTKPFDLDEVGEVVRRALTSAEVSRAAPGPPAAIDRSAMVGRSPAMQSVFKQIALVAASDVSVLITGESGTGKELVARAIHRHSARADRPLVPVNLASLSATLVESELFGHARGAFTGAESERAGLLDLADGGTVFFDETGDIPAAVQVKLLRVLEQKEFTRVGDARPRPSNFRCIAATHRDVNQCQRDGTLRQDLYFRLAGFEIALPALRDRREDIPLLVEHFLAGQADRAGLTATVTPAAMENLCARPWVGNVRELKSAIEHGAIVARGGPIDCAHLPPPRGLPAAVVADSSVALRAAVRQWTFDQLAAGSTSGDLYDSFLAHAEPALFEPVLASTQQNRAAAAERLGIHRATLRKKLNEKLPGGE